MRRKPAVGRTRVTYAEINSKATEGLVLPPPLLLTILLMIALGLSACASCGNHTTSATETTPRDPVADCRAQASEDPYVDKTDNAESAYTACREAAQLNPNNSELAYLLATSSLETERMDEALASFQRAEQLGNCDALYFLGDNAWYVNKDDKSAEAYYKRGAECGDERAAKEVFSEEAFGKSEHPELIAALYNSDMEKLNRFRFATASYVYGFYKELGEQYLSRDFDPCWKATHFRGGEILNQLLAAEKGDAGGIAEGLLYENALPYAFLLLFPDQGTKALEERRESQREAGRADVIRMVESSECKALLPYKIVRGIEEFAKNKKSLLDVVRAEKPNIHSISDIADMVRLKNN